MPKKKKTKKQKQRAIINRQKHLSVMKKPETAIEERQVGLAKETPKAIQTTDEKVKNNKNNFVINNIKRSTVYVAVFMIIIFGLYFIEGKTHYIENTSDNVINLLTK